MNCLLVKGEKKIKPW